MKKIKNFTINITELFLYSKLSPIKILTLRCGTMIASWSNKASQLMSGAKAGRGGGKGGMGGKLVLAPVSTGGGAEAAGYRRYWGGSSFLKLSFYYSHMNNEC